MNTIMWIKQKILKHTITVMKSYEALTESASDDWLEKPSTWLFNSIDKKPDQTHTLYVICDKIIVQK